MSRRAALSLCFMLSDVVASAVSSSSSGGDRIRVSENGGGGGGSGIERELGLVWGVIC